VKKRKVKEVEVKMEWNGGGEYWRICKSKMESI